MNKARFMWTTVVLGCCMLGAGALMTNDNQDPYVVYQQAPEKAYTDAQEAKKKGDLASFVQLMSMYRVQVAGKLSETDRKKIDDAIAFAKDQLRKQVFLPNLPLDSSPFVTQIGIDLIELQPYNVDLDDLLRTQDEFLTDEHDLRDQINTLNERVIQLEQHLGSD